VQLSDFLLRHDRIPPEADAFPSTTLGALQLLPEQALEVYAEVRASRAELRSLSRQMAATS
jgi:hypothetical protein